MLGFVYDFNCEIASSSLTSFGIPRNDRRDVPCNDNGSLRPFYLSLRAKRGNLGGARDCFVATAPRNDRGLNCHFEFLCLIFDFRNQAPELQFGVL